MVFQPTCTIDARLRGPPSTHVKYFDRIKPDIEYLYMLFFGKNLDEEQVPIHIVDVETFQEERDDYLFRKNSEIYANVLPPALKKRITLDQYLHCMEGVDKNNLAPRFILGSDGSFTIERKLFLYDPGQDTIYATQASPELLIRKIMHELVHREIYIAAPIPLGYGPKAWVRRYAPDAKQETLANAMEIAVGQIQNPNQALLQVCGEDLNRVAMEISKGFERLWIGENGIARFDDPKHIQTTLQAIITQCHLFLN